VTRASLNGKQRLLTNPFSVIPRREATRNLGFSGPREEPRFLVLRRDDLGFAQWKRVYLGREMYS
jgi:hypothetical protein